MIVKQSVMLRTKNRILTTIDIDEENNIVWEQACNLIENRTRFGRIVRSGRYNDTFTCL